VEMQHRGYIKQIRMQHLLHGKLHKKETRRQVNVFVTHLGYHGNQ